MVNKKIERIVIISNNNNQASYNIGEYTDDSPNTHISII